MKTVYRYLIPNIGFVEVSEKTHKKIMKGNVVSVPVNGMTMYINYKNFIESRETHD